MRYFFVIGIVDEAIINIISFNIRNKIYSAFPIGFHFIKTFMLFAMSSIINPIV